MIKGFYNENDFYTNNYWNTKFFDELNSKLQSLANLKANTDKIKSLSKIYWDLNDSANLDQVEKNEKFIDFYKQLFTALGFNWSPVKRQTLEGKYYFTVDAVKENEKTHLLLVLTNNKESGSFDSVAFQLADLNFDENEEFDDRELTDIISEELESETGPKWIVVGSLDGLFLIERTKWAFGRFIKIDFKEVFSQIDESVYLSLYGLFAKDVLAPSSGSSIHQEFDDNSHRYAFEVTTKLREGVREAIELLINEMIFAKKEAHQEYLKKDKEANEYAKELSHDALFYVYRLIFLLFLESQGEDSELLPLKSEIYRHGYSLEKLLEVAFKKIQEGTNEFEGTFIQESLEKIFDLIYNGFTPKRASDLIAKDLSSTGFLVTGLKSDLFDPDKVKHLKGVKLRNGVLQVILQKLSMADMKEGKKTRKARVSYSNLGINQLGAVYEGLLSYTGFFAKEELYELTQVKKGKDDDSDDADSGDDADDAPAKVQKIDPDKIYLAPKSLVEKYKKDKKYKLTDKHFVLDPETGHPVTHKKGSFIFRMAGRDRQKLASFYTPESLTKCTVKYALKVLFENKKTLEELKKVKILEPAMGSGAFLNEAVNQLADKILELEVKQEPTKLKTPKERQKRLWDIKYDLISNNVYGVDLNPTAIELAKFSLWLNCIGAGKEPPKFENRLKVGNSLIGARFKKNADGIYPWLMLNQGMLDYGKKLAEYDLDGADKIKKFREAFLASELHTSDEEIATAQKKAECIFNDLIEGKNFEISYSKLKLCSDLWCCAFFLNADDLKFYFKDHRNLLNTMLKVLNDGVGVLAKETKVVLDRISSTERFFHWDIEFGKEISQGGFDLIMGNPPWVVVEWQDALYVSDYNIMPLVLKLNAAGTRKFVEELSDAYITSGLSDQFKRVTGYSKMLETSFYKDLASIPKNTYKTFDVLSFDLLNKDGAFGIIQEDGALEDKAGPNFREILFGRFRYHFQFQNERKLFAEIGNAKRFSVNIFGCYKKPPSFFHIGNLFVPTTVDECFNSDGSGVVPLVKDSSSNWETRGHLRRIISIEKNRLKTFGKFLNDEDSIAPRFLNLHSDALMTVVDKISKLNDTFETFAGGANNCIGSEMFHETGAQDKGYIFKSIVNGKNISQTPDSIGSLVLSGPHINTFSPLSQEAQKEFKSKFSYDSLDLNVIADNFIQRALYSTQIDEKKMDSLFPKLQEKPFRSYFRLITRCMINPTNERCMFSSIIPPGVNHIHGLSSFAVTDESLIPIFCGVSGSLIIDGLQRLQNKTHFFTNDFRNVPLVKDGKYLKSIGRRALSLNGLTVFYSDLWKKCDSFKEDDQLLNGKKLQGFGLSYKRGNALREVIDRSQAAIEIDSLTALHYGLSVEELVQMYQILFPVLSMYDRKEGVDRRSKLIEAYSFFEKRGW